ncbi:DNA repair RAD52-like protein 2, chloroplastic [Solanum stenotomum]|uniref:DNA repair RAD52-like protein 2, chloroplastic n=1 Tax=Solanum stenotomum TaxID=172797 RepID=UPI0020D1B082|nr:DNA repair RAD52-like protein 2, chloroplastic [Solanum stenotomum]
MFAHCTKSSLPAADAHLPMPRFPNPRRSPAAELHFGFNSFSTRTSKLQVKALDRNSNNSSTGDGVGASKNAASSPSSSVPNTNYVVPLDKASSCITRPLAEILRDLNKRIPDNIIKADNNDDHSTFITWYHANRMLSFYAPGWCGEVRDVIFSDNGSVTVVYRVTIRGSDGEAHRESTGTVSPGNGQYTDLVAAAEEMAFCRACARFGLGLYLYH